MSNKQDQKQLDIVKNKTQTDKTSFDSSRKLGKIISIEKNIKQKKNDSENEMPSNKTEDEIDNKNINDFSITKEYKNQLESDDNNREISKSAKEKISKKDQFITNFNKEVAENNLKQENQEKGKIESTEIKNNKNSKKNSFFDTIFGRKQSADKKEKTKKKRDEFFGLIDDNFDIEKDSKQINPEIKKNKISKSIDKSANKTIKTTKDSSGKMLSFLTKSRGNADSEFIIQNLSLFLSSGINILSAIAAMKSETKNKALQKVLDDVRVKIEDGTPLWKALKKTQLINENTISLIKIGEKSGRLVENLNVIATQQQKDKSFRQNIISSIMYPAIVLSMVVIVGLGIAWFILPRLSTVFSSMSMNLPTITKIIIALGNFLNNYGYLFVPGLILLLIFLIYLFFYSSKFKYLGQAFLFKVPGTKLLMQNIQITRMGYVLGALLDAGVPIRESLNSLCDSTSNVAYRKLFEGLRENISEGKSFKKSFSEHNKMDNYIPVPVQQMLVSAEQSGTLPKTLIKIGKMYEEKTEYVTKNLTTILEPILLFVVWGGVLLVALSVIIPIYSLIGGFSQASRNPVKSVPNQSSYTNEILEQNLQKTEEQEKINEVEESSIIKESDKSSFSANKNQIEIVTTETGFLNVRTDPDLNAAVITQVKPGEIYEYIDQNDQWYKIILSNNMIGWVWAEYVKKVEN